MSYAHLFENPVNQAELPADVVIDMAQLDDEQKAVVITWLKAKADQAAALAKLREVLKHALFDVTAAEQGALLHKHGNA